MTTSAAMVAALTVLTEALDDPDTDFARSLQLLSRYGATAIASYRGLSVVVPQSDPPLMFTTLTDGATAEDIRTSLHLQLPGRRNGQKAPTVAITLYAGTPGAFVDLAADLAWLTALPAGDFVLDSHLTLPDQRRGYGQLHAASTINQAIGVLIGRGYTPQQADSELDTRSADPPIRRWQRRPSRRRPRDSRRDSQRRRRGPRRSLAPTLRRNRPRAEGFTRGVASNALRLSTSPERGWPSAAATHRANARGRTFRRHLSRDSPTLPLQIENLCCTASSDACPSGE